MAVATVDDVATTLGRPLSEVTTEEQAQWDMWLGDAERQIRKRLGDITLLDQDDLAYVEREAVALKVKRPDPAQQITVTVDDGTVSRRYERDAGQVTILPEWWALLSPSTESAGIYSVRPYFEADQNADTYPPAPASLDWS